MNLTYKIVNNKDVDFIVELNKLMRKEEPEFYGDFDEEEFRMNWSKYPIDSNFNSDVILCLDGNKVVGRVDLMYEQSYMDFTKVGYIDWIYTRVKYRGKGIGKQLLIEAEKLFKEKGCKKYYLFIADNDQAIKFYDSTDLKISTKKTGVKDIK